MDWFLLKVVEVKSSGMVSTRKINRRHLLKSSGGWTLPCTISYCLLFHSTIISTKISGPIYMFFIDIPSLSLDTCHLISRMCYDTGLRPRDIRSVDPSLWLTNTMPSLLVWGYLCLLLLMLEEVSFQFTSSNLAYMDLMKFYPTSLSDMFFSHIAMLFLLKSAESSSFFHGHQLTNDILVPGPRACNSTEFRLFAGHSDAGKCSYIQL